MDHTKRIDEPPTRDASAGESDIKRKNRQDASVLSELKEDLSD